MHIVTAVQQALKDQALKDRPPYVSLCVHEEETQFYVSVFFYVSNNYVHLFFLIPKLREPLKHSKHGLRLGWGADPECSLFFKIEGTFITVGVDVSPTRLVNFFLAYISGRNV